ncbi:glycosyltransferase [Bacillus dakarensis]|uniref:glycosyltransferase n=1 Tax=Robertmurraya dakarensis TaxID=1926278 RepID=UPI000A056752|nr:glycosyltransferase [Bacillus dakarensis]
MEGVSIITVTKRKKSFFRIIDNFNRQLCENKELIIILNRAGMNTPRWKRYARRYKNVSVYRLPELSLGASLNFGIEVAKYPVIAKFDDDDYYAPNYLSQALHALATTDASIVGKMSVSTYFKATNLLAIRKPGNENCYINGIGFEYSHLGGGTLVWKKSIYPLVTFPDRNLGEDVIFQERCEEQGFKIYSTDKNYYVSIRHKNKRKHTWRSSDRSVLKDCEIVDYTDNYEPYIGGDDYNPYKGELVEDTFNREDDKLNGVSVITCTIRQDQMNNILDNYNRQKYENKELIIILNRSNMNIEEWRERIENYQNVSVYEQPDITLGECLNFGITIAKHPIVAKLDDDDYYGPMYLTQAVHALNTTKAALVGKDAQTIYFEGKNLLALFRSYNENKYTTHVGGCTLVFRKSIFPNVKFPSKSLNEDNIFQQRCRNLGYKIYSTDRYHHVYIRRENKEVHSWKAEDEELLKECEVITHTDDYRPFVDVETDF